MVVFPHTPKRTHTLAPKYLTTGTTLPVPTFGSEEKIPIIHGKQKSIDVYNDL